MNEQRRVLFVDDDADFSQAMATRCQALGLKAMTAKNALTALDIAARWRPDVVCFDVEMPTGNGLDVCEFLTSDAHLAQSTFVVVTGRKDRETIRRCGELGARYIAKSPTTWRHLHDVLNEAFPEIGSAAEPMPLA
jgi:CheY-like chemotaxis protein